VLERLDVGSRTFHDAQLATKAVERAFLKRRWEIGGKRMSDGRHDGVDHFRKAFAHVLPHRVVRRRRHAQFGDDFREHAVGQHFTIGQHAVEVEDDQHAAMLCYVVREAGMTAPARRSSA